MQRSFILVVVVLFTLSTNRLTAKETDLLIVGGTESGWAAAVQAARMGVEKITIVHDGRWLGGQYTEQALACVDENKGVGKVGWGVDWHPMKRSFHRSGLFKELMDQIEAFNAKKYGSKMPGKPYHGPSTFRPAEAEAIFREMLQPYVDAGQLRVIWEHYPVAATLSKDGQTLTGLTFKHVGNPTAKPITIEAKLTIDASDWGEAIQVAGAAFEVGPDPQSRYGESEAPKDLAGYPPNEMNPITWAMIIEEAKGAAPLPRPAHFDDRNYVRTTKLSLEAMKGLPWDRPVRLGSIPHWPDAGARNASPRQLSVYNVRRIVDGYTSNDGKTAILLNYMLGQDYPLERLPQHVIDALEKTEAGASKKNIVTMTREQRQIIFDDAKSHALGVLHHMQNFVHDRVPDKTHSFRNFELSDEFGTDDRLPPKPYIRESLRLKAMYMMREQDARNTDGKTKQFAREAFANVMYPDGVFAWQFHYDFHRTGRAYLEGEGASGPWIDFEKLGRNTHIVSDRATFPLRSLVPVEMDGLIGAQKNVGYSSIVSAAIRLHDQCVHIGQAAGATAAICLRDEITPRSIPLDRSRLEQVRDALCGGTKDATPLLLYPFRDLPADHGAFVAANRLAAIDALPLGRRDIDFCPNDPATDEWQAAVATKTRSVLKDGHSPPLPRIPRTKQPLTRGQFATIWWSVVRDIPLRPFPSSFVLAEDSDNDGFVNGNDALPFSAEPRSWPIEKVAPEADGLIDDKQAGRRINFGSVTGPGFDNDQGKPFNARRGFGWTRDITKNARHRHVYSESYRDTFLFTRSHDTWELATKNGPVHVTVCIGDSGHDQTGQHVTIEGKPLFIDHNTRAGHFAEHTIDINVTDGRLTIEIGKPGRATNTCLNWIVVESSNRSAN